MVWLCRGNPGNLKIPFDFFCHELPVTW
jgi:hypothetical protein